MTLPIYPGRELLPGLAVTSRWSPQFFVQSARTATGAEIDLAIAQHPIHEFELRYSLLRDGPDWETALSAMEFRTLMGFFLSLTGSAGRFLYRNPHDFEVWRNRIGTGDGTTDTFTLTRTYGANGYFGTEPVGEVNLAAGVNVWLGTSATPVDPDDYTIDTTTPGANTIAFDTAPTDGTAVSIDMQYRYFCKLGDANPTFERFMHRIWNIGSVKLRSCRPGT